LRDEYTIELLYRLNLLQRFTITPDVQVLFHPALNPESGRPRHALRRMTDLPLSTPPVSLNSNEIKIESISST